MNKMIRFEEIVIEPVFTERELNFRVLDTQGYLFRLVPGYAGFELSLLDRSLGVEPERSFVQKVGEFINNYYL